MDNSLQRLLDAELEAEAVVKNALDRREQIMAQSLEEAHMAEALSLIHISEPTRPPSTSRMPSSA